MTRSGWLGIQANHQILSEVEGNRGISTVLPEAFCKRLAMIGPNARPIFAVPSGWIAKRAISTTTVRGST